MTERLASLLAQLEGAAPGSCYQLVDETYRALSIEFPGGDGQRQAFEQVLARYVDAKAYTDAALTLAEACIRGPIDIELMHVDRVATARLPLRGLWQLGAHRGGSLALAILVALVRLEMAKVHG